MGKRGQAANEAAMITLMVLFVLSIFMAVLSDELADVVEKNYKDSLEAVADVVEAEANIALGAEEGYYHSFVLPPRLAGSRYTFEFINSTLLSTSTVKINASIIRIHALQGDRTYHTDRMLQPNVLGNLVRAAGSLNSVRKEKGEIIFKPARGANPPAILTVSPKEGPGAGGTTVVITGTDFVNPVTVSFGGASAAVTFDSITQLTAVTPAHAAGQADVVVTNPDLQPDTLNGGFTYVGSGGGLPNWRPCNNGAECASGWCGDDDDNDGFSDAGSGICRPDPGPGNYDCDDSVWAVKPRQASHFTYPRSDGTFDYDCDGLETPSPSFNCLATVANNPGCSGSSLPGKGGYTSSIPACGSSGTFRMCRQYSGSGCSTWVGDYPCSDPCNVNPPTITRVKTYDYTATMGCK